MNIDKKLAELTINPHRIPLQAPGLTYLSDQYEDEHVQALRISKLDNHESLDFPSIRFDEKPYTQEGYYAQPYSLRQTLNELVNATTKALDDVEEQTYAFAIQHVWTLDDHFQDHLEDALESYAAYRLASTASERARTHRAQHTRHEHTLQQFYTELARYTKDAADTIRHALANTLPAEHKQRLYAVDESLLDISRNKRL